MVRRRGTAYKVTVKALLQADYIQREPPHPNYLRIYNEEVTRVNIVGIVVQTTSHEVVIDDGTARITAKLFNDNLTTKNVDPGQPVLLIGRPRVHKDTLYLGAEILNALNTKDWVAFRKKEIKQLYTETEPTPQTQPPQKPKDKQLNYSEAIIQAIDELDDGDGAPTDKVLEQVNDDRGEQHIQSLINEGEIFELRPGKLKVL
jgi:RPA family protein